LWKYLSDNELFAVRLYNGEIGYCSVMGELGRHIALALYIGRGGLDSHREFLEAKDIYNEMHRHEKMMAQNCLQCSFENKDSLSPTGMEVVKLERSGFFPKPLTNRI
jgi:hypothetical protein